MGIIHQDPDAFDAFFSYSWSDNNDKFVTHFHKKLREKFSAALKGKYPDGAEPAFFMDMNDLEANGALGDTLKQKVLKSEFLFIFLSKNYWRSKWCTEEFEAFRKKFDGKRTEALHRTFVIVLEKLTNSELEEFKAKLWHEQDEPILQTFYDEISTHPLPFYINIEGEAAVVFHDKVSRKLDKIVATMVKRIATGRSAVASDNRPGSDRVQRVTLGVVTSDLETTRENLTTRLASSGISVEKLALADISGDDADQLVKGKLADSNVFVQLYSHARVLQRVMIRGGGHLRFQRELVGQSTKQLCWHIESDPRDNLSENDVKEEADPAHREFLSNLDNECEMTQSGPLEKLVELLQGNLSGISPTVLIENNPKDQEISRLLVDLIKSRWKQVYGDDLNCYSLDWSKLAECVRGCEGIILLYRNKNTDSLLTQVKEIDKCIRSLRLKHEPARRVAVDQETHPEETNILFWPTIDFRPAGDHIIIPQDSEKFQKMLADVFRSAQSTMQIG